MIRLTRLNGRPFIVNADLIKFIEQAPDTVITLVTGEKLVVRELVEDVLMRIHTFHLDSGRRIADGNLDDVDAKNRLTTAAEFSQPPGSIRTEDERS
jgi:flagellar protein FlbD